MAEAHGKFLCPLRAEVFTAEAATFADAGAVNRAVACYRGCTSAAERGREARAIYLRHLPLVKKILARFCAVSACYPGACYPQELLGESFLAFRAALDDYDPERGVDFLGYVALRMHRALRQRTYALRAPRTREEPGPAPEHPPQRNTEEERMLDVLFARELVQLLGKADARLLLQRYADGYRSRELAVEEDATDAAIRKRLQRALERARTLAGEEGAERAEEAEGGA